VTLLAASTFMQVLLAAFLIIPVVILWVAAVVDVIQRGGSGLRIAAVLVLVLIVPILGPILYFIFRPAPRESAEDVYRAQTDRRREAAGRTVGPRV
jgi:Phospholipase_D-nuclease N-terminal